MRLITYIIQIHLVMTYVLIFFLILLYCKKLYDSINYLKHRFNLNNIFLMWFGTCSLFAMLTAAPFIPDHAACGLFDRDTGAVLENPAHIEYITKKIILYINQGDTPNLVILKLSSDYKVSVDLPGLLRVVEAIRDGLVFHTITDVPIDLNNLVAFIEKTYHLIEVREFVENDPECQKRINDFLNPPPRIPRRTVYKLVEDTLIAVGAIMGIIAIVKGAAKAYHYFYPKKPTIETVTNIIPDAQPVIEKPVIEEPVIEEPVITLYEQIQNISSLSDLDLFIKRVWNDLSYYFWGDTPIINGILWAIQFYLLNKLFRYYIPALLEERRQKKKLKKLKK